MNKIIRDIVVMGKMLQYLFKDEFSATIAAGSINGTLSTDSKDTRAVVDTNSKISMGSGLLSFATGAVANDGIRWGARTRLAGRAAFIRTTPSSTAAHHQDVGWDDTASGAPLDTIRFTNLGVLQVLSNGSGMVILETFSAGTTYSCAVVMRGTGMFYFIKGGAYIGWTLLWIKHIATNSLYPFVGAIGTTSVFTVDSFRVADLPAPFSTDYGIATQQLSGARSAGDVFIHEPNCWIEWIVTTRVDAQYVYFRAQDANNYWRVDVAADGSMALQEVVDGTPTSRGTAAASSIANTQRILVRADGTTIKVFANNVAVITYATATNFATATAGKLLALGTGGAISNIVSYPRMLSGIAENVLNKYATP